MSRKATITQKEIVNAAFKITKKEGFEQITSRKLAAAAGCSPTGEARASASTTSSTTVRSRGLAIIRPTSATPTTTPSS